MLIDSFDVWKCDCVGQDFLNEKKNYYHCRIINENTFIYLLIFFLIVRYLDKYQLCKKNMLHKNVFKLIKEIKQKIVDDKMIRVKVTKK